MESGDKYRIGKLQAGYTRWLATRSKFKAGLGGSVGVAILPSTLQPAYGRRTPGELGLFVTLATN